MYRIGIFERDAQTDNLLEQIICAYGNKMQLQFEICRWKTEEELMADIESRKAPDILYLPIGDRVSIKDDDKTRKRSWWDKIDGRTREAQLMCFYEVKKEVSPWTGIALGLRLRERLDFCRLQLIYYAQEERLYEGMMHTQALDLLTEPLEEKAVLAALRKAMELIKSRNQRLIFQKENEYYILPTQDIQYICGDGRNVIVRTVAAEYQFRARLKDIEGILPEDFLAIHRSYIINKNFVQRYHYEYIEMQDGTAFSISNPNRGIVRRILLDR